jgi:YaiO family outer membrane protein
MGPNQGRRWLSVPVLLGAVALLGVPPSALGQEDDLKRAHELAYNQHRSEALALLEGYLRQSPTDTDALTFYGIVLSWEGRYDEARKELDTVLERYPDHGDALPALINVELWSHHFARAEELARSALANRPNDIALLMTRARALQNLQRPNDALDVLANLLEVDPNQPQARGLRDDLRDAQRHFEAAVVQSYDWFNDGRPAWLESQVSLKYQMPSFGSVIARFSHASRFGLDSSLMEIDAYPRIRKGLYAYLNVGWSPDKQLYPGNRFGAELFQSLPHAMEVSGGLRSLYFGSRVNIYTGSVSKYRGRWLMTARTYLTPGSVGDSYSLQLQARRYFGDDTSYVAARYGIGAAPIDTGSLNEIEVLRSHSMGGELNWKLARRWTLNAMGSHSLEDRVYQSRLGHNSATIAAYFRF